MLRLFLNWWDRGSSDALSRSWVRSQAKLESRIEYHGPAWNFGYLIREMKAKERRKTFRRVA